MTAFTESIVEQAAPAWLESVGWQVRHGAEIAPGEPAAERDDYARVVLARRLCDALARLNPALPERPAAGGGGAEKCGRENATIWSAFQQLQTYQAEVPVLFAANALLAVSDGVEARVGTLCAGHEWFKPWRTVADDTLAGANVAGLQMA